ncbi:flagellar basal body rod protein FlgC [Paenibacillus sp. SC116]|uniref:Flagellar basal-body rod protein FlgC n=1 Tax=Paenibacillus agilis TaxID=3020863 RepID=A0A559J275_9BACL|nr:MULTISPECIES: flagellar basal body rod protein FlgC [Paenibacillus]MCR8845443.1 flagellar basal body rod protein FlgC [Paenibacillus sp. SC116]TVX93984.1 flagellar basal body rod protein FlgC [Paenibacillus agilis]
MMIGSSFQISASGLTAQRLRMDVISANIANAESTRAQYVNGQFVPYRRKMVAMSPTEPTFQQSLNAAMNGQSTPRGVKVTQIKADETPFKRVYQPTHPDADAQGYVSLPNVDIAKEMVDMISATRSYEANVTALNASKSMIMKALEIGRG